MRYIYLDGKTEQEIEEKLGIPQQTLNDMFKKYCTESNHLTDFATILASTSKDEETQQKQSINPITVV
jgi:hypothetical protein